MALDSILNFFKLPSDDDYEEDDYETGGSGYSYDEYDDPGYSRQSTARKRVPKPVKEVVEPEEDTKKNGFVGSTKAKVVSMNRGNSIEMNIVKPTKFDEASEIGDILISGHPVIVNLEGFDTQDAQRVVDFVSGCVYAIRGSMKTIARNIFLFVPENVEINTDALGYSDSSQMSAPKINSEF